MNTRNEMADRVKRLTTNIKELKSNQTIGGDSWLVYRYQINYTKSAGGVSKITFTPDIAGSFVAQVLWFYPPNTPPKGSDQDITPDPNINGVWWECSYAASAVSRAIMVYSTKKGTAKIEQWS